MAFAVLTDAGNKKESQTFNYSYFRTTLDYRCSVCEVSDYEEKELTESKRHDSKVVLAMKYMHETIRLILL